jgi:MinD superfamily P-loop ATPase
MSRSLRIAIASGKGGTGKTTIATSLAHVLAEAGLPATYVDCDVEEPNGHLFLRPTIERSLEVAVPVPEIDPTRCSLCGACSRACRYSAIIALPTTVVTFPKLCHGCGGCTLACADRAIREVPRVTGIVEEGTAGPVRFLHGKLDIGEAMAPPVIRAVLAADQAEGTVVIDAPPGTSCPVIESLRGANVALLVTEPTPFGLHDLKLAVEMVRALGLPGAVAVNRVGTADDTVFDYCARERLPVVLTLPDSRAIARAYSRGELAVVALPELQPLFIGLHDTLRDLAFAQKPGPTRKPARPIPTHAGTPDAGRRPSEQLELGQQRELRELVVISGKGGTGKTSLVASFCALAEQAAVADCDVDAADLHLVLDPSVRQRWPFSGGMTAVIDPVRCTGCGLCEEHCRFDAIRTAAGGAGADYVVDAVSCEGCGVCADVCPEQAVHLVATADGEWFVSDTRCGPMIHARLGIAQENSGKLVSLVRREAKAVALSHRLELLICDGSPGIGCPVIASITGARMALVVTEPTLSGLHDFRRVAELCRQLRVATALCINKADLNSGVAEEIETEAARLAVPLLGRIRYDEAVTSAQVRKIAVVENGDGPAAADMRALWRRVRDAVT